MARGNAGRGLRRDVGLGTVVDGRGQPHQGQGRPEAGDEVGGDWLVALGVRGGEELPRKV